MRCVVTGANRGIGLEMVRQLIARGDQVDAAVREPDRADALRALAAGDRLRVHRLDVLDAGSIRELAAALGGAPVDLLVNNAGVYGGSRQHLPDIDIEDAVRTYRINALGPLQVTLALLPGLKAARGKVIHVTSGMGSIADNRSGAFYAYRMSKAALNMMSRSLAVDLRGAGVASAVINPGWVRTDMGGASAPTAVEDSVRGMLREIDAFTLDATGAFLDWKGRPYPW
ncbi:MAG TPA: SDR family oxidoreductase [Kofleriaceae bacterium]|nr:SDR family oxidoreductase [Kofleriaceae bacterium]